MPILVRHRPFSRLALAGRPGEVPLPLSHVGEALLPPHPHPIVRQLKLPSSTGCSRRLNVPCGHSSSVLWSRLASEAAQRASSSTRCVSCRLSKAAACSRCSRSSSLRSPSSPLQGGWESLLFLSQAASAAKLPTPSELALAGFPQRQQAAVAPLPAARLSSRTQQQVAA